MRHYPRLRTINEASLINWKDCQDRYSVELYTSLIDAQDQARQYAEPIELVFGGGVIEVTLTDIEDILELVRTARIDIAKARGLAAA